MWTKKSLTFMCFVHLLQNLWCPRKFYPASSTNVLGKVYDPSSFSGFFFMLYKKITFTKLQCIIYKMY